MFNGKTMFSTETKVQQWLKLLEDASASTSNLNWAINKEQHENSGDSNGAFYMEPGKDSGYSKAGPLWALEHLCNKFSYELHDKPAQLAAFRMLKEKLFNTTLAFIKEERKSDSYPFGRSYGLDDITKSLVAIFGALFKEKIEALE